MECSKLIALRKKYGYSQYDMASLLKISQSYYSQIENGQKNLYYDVAVRIAKIFNLKPDEVFYPTNGKK